MLNIQENLCMHSANCRMQRTVNTVNSSNCCMQWADSKSIGNRRRELCMHSVNQRVQRRAHSLKRIVNSANCCMQQFALFTIVFTNLCMQQCIGGLMSAFDL